ncbi:hypothetical protein KPL70_004857 [Citrus sinensis]|nr:hypothetical protein KPL70_004857 [Citrus sinensis]
MDLKTVSMMGKPRCGVPDVINGTTRMQGGPAHYHTHYDYDAADVKISFQRGDHGDGYPFDGPGPYNLLAHSFPPTDGRFHYDGDENWTVGAVPGAVDMQTVALHELRHVLGLAHRP